MRHTHQQSHVLLSTYSPDVKHSVVSAETQTGALGSNSPSVCPLFQTWDAWKLTLGGKDVSPDLSPVSNVRPGSKEGEDTNGKGRNGRLPIRERRRERRVRLRPGARLNGGRGSEEPGELWVTFFLRDNHTYRRPLSFKNGIRFLSINSSSIKA